MRAAVASARQSPLWSDARHYQIAALASLLLINFVWIDFGAKPLNSALAIASALRPRPCVRAGSVCLGLTCARR